MVTVTSRLEDEIAAAAGADALVVQGPAAGGHRSVFGPDQRPPDRPLAELLSRTWDLGRAAGDPHDTNLWAGTSWRSSRVGSAADIVASLAG